MSSCEGCAWWNTLFAQDIHRTLVGSLQGIRGRKSGGYERITKKKKPAKNRGSTFLRGLGACAGLRSLLFYLEVEGRNSQKIRQKNCRRRRKGNERKRTEKSDQWYARELNDWDPAAEKTKLGKRTKAGGWATLPFVDPVGTRTDHSCRYTNLAPTRRD